MAVRGSARRQPDAYFELVHRFPLTVIRDDDHLDRAVEMIDELIDRIKLSAGEQEYLDALSALVECYEKDTIPVKPVGGVAMLKHLMEAKGVNQSEVAQGANIAESTVSEILAGKRRISRDHVGTLARFFNIDRSVFIGDW
ncbi:MAG TPA: helix-turn-helix domain-containing protein [Gemmataceae bacterium]